MVLYFQVAYFKYLLYIFVFHWALVLLWTQAFLDLFSVEAF